MCLGCFIVTITTLQPNVKGISHAISLLALLASSSSCILGSSNSLGHLEAMLQMKKIDIEGLKGAYTRGNNRR
jgi:hypothetical protein